MSDQQQSSIVINMNSIFNYFALLVIAFNISACDPVSVAVSAGASTGLAAYQERGIKGFTRDTAIEANVFKNWINTDKAMVKFMSIEVYERRVLLTGIAKNEEQRALAAKLAWKTDGVIDVINEIIVGKMPNFMEVARDAAITTEIKSRLTFNKNILAVNYTIETIQGTVFLLGIAQSQTELNRVLDLVKGISYVRRVISHVRVKEPHTNAAKGDSS